MKRLIEPLAEEWKTPSKLGGATAGTTLLRSTGLLLACFFLLAGGWQAQALRFDVVSVKAVTADNPYSGHAVGVQVSPGRLVYDPASIQQLMITAYGLFPYQIAGLPDWGKTKLFAIEATAPEKTTRSEMMEMLQATLAERFGLQTHTEMRDTAVWDLVPAKSGPKIGPNLHPAGDGSKVRNLTPAGVMFYSGKTMAEFSNTVSFMLARGQPIGSGRPVIDKTGLIGAFDITLDTRDTAGTGEMPQMSFMDVVERQLGLRLAAGTEPVKTLVIDHLQMPSGN